MNKKQLEIVIEELRKENRSLKNQLEHGSLYDEVKLKDIAKERTKIKKYQNEILSLQAEVLHFKKLLNQTNKDLYELRRKYESNSNRLVK